MLTLYSTRFTGQAGTRSRKLALGHQVGEENEINQNRLDILQENIKDLGSDLKELQVAVH